MVVILGKTLAEARFWKAHYMAVYPELANAKEISSFQEREFPGLQVTKIFVAPGEYRNMHVLETLKFRYRKTTGRRPVDEDIVYLGSKM